jgi:hypothetical protein
MSPALVPKPDDWKNNIGIVRDLTIAVLAAELDFFLSLDVVGFYFLDLASTYQPPPELVAFLAAGKPPVYIGCILTNYLFSIMFLTINGSSDLVLLSWMILLASRVILFSFLLL